MRQLILVVCTQLFDMILDEIYKLKVTQECIDIFACIGLMGKIELKSIGLKF